MRRTRDVSKFKELGHWKHANIDSALSNPLNDGLHSVSINNRWFDFIYEDRGHKITMVTFAAAINAKAPTYPHFSSGIHAKNMGMNFLGFSDVAFGGPESLPTFWHLSIKAVPVQRWVQQIITHVKGSGQHLLFFGSSAGGYAVLNYSRFFPGSAALVMNPRINLLMQPIRFNKYAAKAWPGREAKSVARALPSSMSYTYRRPHGNNVFYLQNTNDDLYYQYHYEYFARSVKSRDDVEFVLDDWGEGHVVPPRDLYKGFLRDLRDSAPNWLIKHS